MILQEKAELYMITPAQDTVLLHTDFARSGFGDGETDYSQAARCRTPLFTDANGDGREDFMVETSTGQALFFQQRDGSFKP
jgi:hypothetical protein